MNRQTQRDLLLLLGVYLLTKEDDPEQSLFQRVNTALNNAGARLYEALHPSEKNHANDLPRPGRMRGQLPPEVIMEIASLAGFPNPKFAAAIAMAESRGFPDAVNRSAREYSVGLWQINTLVHPYTPAQMADPLQNAHAAFLISKGGTDWRPWSVYTKNKYQAFQKGVLA